MLCNLFVVNSTKTGLRKTVARKAATLVHLASCPVGPWQTGARGRTPQCRQLSGQWRWGPSLLLPEACASRNPFRLWSKVHTGMENAHRQIPS